MSSFSLPSCAGNAQPVVVETISKPSDSQGCAEPISTGVVIGIRPPDSPDYSLESGCSDTCGKGDGHEHECEICHKIFNTCLHLLQHSLVHSKELPFMCMNCGAVFSCQEDESKHKSVHMNKELYQCVMCGESSPDETTFQEHILKHYGQPSFDCHLCPAV
ncbi:hypothetical protein HPB50_000606 [Hyalomma asiaticum]|uniref:Uncharacterized protein n=1 Tax=Hyalomma asiaticum TaxID=266040 RepID=A0ACB7RH31_HYAAI|nr:hypothetical protein HPB50_000606 [Hyalomma asiaticum]